MTPQTSTEVTDTETLGEALALSFAQTVADASEVESITIEHAPAYATQPPSGCTLRVRVVQCEDQTFRGAAAYGVQFQIAAYGTSEELAALDLPRQGVGDTRERIAALAVDGVASMTEYKPDTIRSVAPFTREATLPDGRIARVENYSLTFKPGQRDTTPRSRMISPTVEARVNEDGKLEIVDVDVERFRAQLRRDSVKVGATRMAWVSGR